MQKYLVLYFNQKSSFFQPFLIQKAKRYTVVLFPAAGPFGTPSSFLFEKIKKKRCGKQSWANTKIATFFRFLLTLYYYIGTCFRRFVHFLRTSQHGTCIYNDLHFR